MINLNVDMARRRRARRPASICWILGAAARLDIADQESRVKVVTGLTHVGSLNAYAGNAHVIALNLEQGVRMVVGVEEGSSLDGLPGNRGTPVTIRSDVRFHRRRIISSVRSAHVRLVSLVNRNVVGTAT